MANVTDKTFYFVNRLATSYIPSSYVCWQYLNHVKNCFVLYMEVVDFGVFFFFIYLPLFYVSSVILWRILCFFLEILWRILCFSVDPIKNLYFSGDPMKIFMFYRRSYVEFYVLIFSSKNEFVYLMFESIQVLFIQILFLLIRNIDNKVMICFIFWLYLIKLLSLWLINHTLIHCLRNGCC
jgi:hypothetical protein